MISKSVSVVIPCFNEGKTIGKNVRTIENFLRRNFSDFEIIAINDGSPDETLSELQKIQKEIPIEIINNAVNQGKGGAVRDGMAKVRKEIVMFLDADLAIPIEELPKFVREIERGSDLVIASRFVKGLKVVKPVLWHRQIMEKVFRLLRMIITNNWEVKDTQCGFKVFTQKAAAEIFPKMTVSRFAFDAEIIFIAKKLGYGIKELPITLQNPVASSVRIFRDPWNMLWDLLKIRHNGFLGKYRQSGN